MASSDRGPMGAVEIRKNPDGSIDEICAQNCGLHIEQMSDDGWFMGIEGSDGGCWQFWFGSKNRKSHVEFRHTEYISAEEERARKSPALASHPTPPAVGLQELEALDAKRTKGPWFAETVRDERLCFTVRTERHGFPVADFRATNLGVGKTNAAFIVALENAWSSGALRQGTVVPDGWDEAIEAAAKVADGFNCGGCGMDGKAAAAIRAMLSSSPSGGGIGVVAPIGKSNEEN